VSGGYQASAWFVNSKTLSSAQALAWLPLAA
jgi:hypothetical protein